MDSIPHTAGHPTAVDVSLAALGYLQKNKERLFKNIEQLEKTFKKGISEINFKNTINLRIKGAAIGLDLQDDDYASEVKERALKKGLMINTEASSLLFLPNFQMTQESALEGIDLLKSCV